MKLQSITKSLALATAFALPSMAQAEDVSLDEVRAIAKEAYIYGYPMVDSYRIEYGYFVDKTDPEYKGPANEIHNTPRVYTPADKAIQTPNSDTPYSWLFMDLRTEPIVLTMPVIEKGRYFSIQLTDLYTLNWDYLSSRTTGNDGGSFMITGPGWKGEKPPGVSKVLQCETDMTSCRRSMRSGRSPCMNCRGAGWWPTLSTVTSSTRRCCRI
jgi:hypothetical protein